MMFFKNRFESLRRLVRPGVILLMLLSLVVSACAEDPSAGEDGGSETTTTVGGNETTTTAGSDVATTTTASAGDECEGYPNDLIRLIVPYSPGGAFDTWGRLIGPYLEKHLPNNPTVVVDNRPGAGGIVGATMVYTAEPDGYTIGITEPGILATTQIGGQTEIDLNNITALGRLTLSPEIIVVSSESEYETIEDVQAAHDESNPALMATGGLAAVNIVSFDALGIPYENVVHEGSSESLLSVQRGDTDIAIFTLVTLIENLRIGDMRPLVVVGPKPTGDEVGAEELADIPTLDEAVGIEGVGGALSQHRILHAPPGLPECMLTILSDATQAALSDPELLAEAEAVGQLPPVPADAAETQEIVANTLTQLTEYSELLLEHLES